MKILFFTVSKEAFFSSEFQQIWYVISYFHEAVFYMKKNSLLKSRIGRISGHMWSIPPYIEKMGCYINSNSLEI